MTTSLEKGISDIVGVFTDPILVFPGGWGDTITWSQYHPTI
jgi:hypothetical protein